ncbi:hypothetical protein ASD04_00115 [Devosia sp. Root436]|nr:hypothetical protein ASD04_00115 [Devosia sp. Root436]
MDPSKMRDRIEIWRQTLITDENDWEVEHYVLHRTIWGRIRYQSGREFREKGMAGATTLATFSIRWRDDIAQQDMLKSGDTWWNIRAVVPVGFKVGVDINAESAGEPPSHD